MEGLPYSRYLQNNKILPLRLISKLTYKSDCYVKVFSKSEVNLSKIKALFQIKTLHNKIGCLYELPTFPYCIIDSSPKKLLDFIIIEWGFCSYDSKRMIIKMQIQCILTHPDFEDSAFWSILILTHPEFFVRILYDLPSNQLSLLKDESWIIRQ